MAELEEEKTETKPPRKKKLMVGGVIGGVMLVEAVLVFALVKMFAPTPPPALAAGGGGLDPAEGEAKVMDAEIQVVSFRARNDKSAEPVIYDMTIFAVVPDSKKEEFTNLVAAKQATIQDRLTSVVRSADSERFLEPDLATLRDRFLHELSQIFQDQESIKEILIPSIIPYRE